MPKGIPDIDKTEVIPRMENEKWDLNVQEHKAKRAGRHFDLRLSPKHGIVHSWASRKDMPEPGEKTLVIQQPDHTRDYLGFSGKIEEGYGEGDVKSTIEEDIEVLDSAPDRITFNRYEGNDVQRFLLKRTSGKGKGSDWLLYNYTVTTDSPINKIIPDYKLSYEDIPYNSVGVSSTKSEGAKNISEDEILSPKFDGAHNTILLRPGKRIDTYSYRLRKNKPTRIDHSYKTNLYKKRSPKNLGNSVVRTELYLPKSLSSSSEVISGILNSNTWKAREKLKELNAEIKPIIFDVVRYKDKHVEDLPYKDKLEILKNISEEIPELKLPELAKTSRDKLKLLDDIKSGKHPLTDEGVVVYNLQKSTPRKAKIKSDTDALITGVYSSTPGSKYDKNGIGGFIVLPEGKKTPIRVGSGISDELRRSAYLSPDAFIGSWIKLEGGRTYSSGKVRTPIFKGFRTDKYINKT